MKRFGYWIEYILLRLAAWLINCIPYSCAVKFTRNVGEFLYVILKDRREIALKNLRASFPEKNEAEIQKIAKGAFRHLGQIAIEVISIPKLNQKGFIKTSNAQNVWKALEEKRGVIFIVSHFTNWEVMAVATAKEGFPMNAIARPLKNPFVYAHIKKLRGYAGLRSIDKLGALRQTVKLLKDNQVVSFLIDQHERQGAIVTQFFGRPCYTSSFAAQVALKWKVPVVPLFCYRDQNGILTTDFEKPFQLVDTGNLEEDAKQNTQMFITNIEKKVRQYPENWLWMHRRWRV